MGFKCVWAFIAPLQLFCEFGIVSRSRLGEGTGQWNLLPAFGSSVSHRTHGVGGQPLSAWCQARGPGALMGHTLHLGFTFT